MQLVDQDHRGRDQMAAAWRPRRRRCGWPSSSPATCRCRCTTSRRTPRTRSRPASSTRNLQCEHRSRAKTNMYSARHPPPHAWAQQAWRDQVANARSYCVPGGVAQQRLRSSTCSTSSPRSQAPSDTSSFANRCRIGLRVVPPRVSTHARTWSVAVAVGPRQTAGAMLTDT